MTLFHRDIALRLTVEANSFETATRLLTEAGLDAYEAALRICSQVEGATVVTTHTIIPWAAEEN